jgi:predicted nicotinamide N-methyase
VPPDTIDEVVVIAGRDLVIARPADSESLLDAETFAEDEFIPYWAELWPSARALARWVGDRTLRGARVLELGCGLGLPSVAAALAGGRVLATDWSADSVDFTRRNAVGNGATLEAAVMPWDDTEALVAAGPWDLVIGSDLLYERRNVALMLDLLENVADHAVIADPGRPASVEFAATAATLWDLTTIVDDGPPRVTLYELRRPD